MAADSHCRAHAPLLRASSSTRAAHRYPSDADERLFHLAEYAQMLATYARFGGLMDAEQYVALMRNRIDQPLSQMARWIVDRDLVLICDRSGMEVPMFQFTPGTCERIPAVRAVIGELRDSHSDWDIALWFVSRNGQLQDRLPIELVHADESSVRAAARADRFALMG